MGEFSPKKINEIGSLYENIISEQPAKGVTAKVGPVRVGVTDPKTDIGARASRAIGGFLSGLKSKAQQFGAEAERQIQKAGGYPKTAGEKVAGVVAGPTGMLAQRLADKTKPAPAARPAAAKPATAPAPARPAATVKSTPTPAAKPSGSAMDQWRANFPKLAAKVTPAGTQKGTGQSVMAKQAADLRDLRPAASETGPQAQSALPGDAYSPAATAKMTTRTKNILGVKEQHDAYDIVLEYLLSQGHVDTLDEAHYVMIEMPAETIRGIIEQSNTLVTPEQRRADELKYGMKRTTQVPPPKQPATVKTGPNPPRMPL